MTQTQKPGTWERHGWGMMQSTPGRRQKRSHYWLRCRPRFNPVFWESLCGERTTHYKPLPEDVCGRCVRCAERAEAHPASPHTEKGEGTL